MSEIPGYTLEAFVEWEWNFVVIGESDKNFNLAVAEMLNGNYKRPRITKEQFDKLVALYEPYREMIEYRLDQFDEENQSWRGYCNYVTEGISPDDELLINTMVKLLKTQADEELGKQQLRILIVGGGIRPEHLTEYAKQELMKLPRIDEEVDHFITKNLQPTPDPDWTEHLAKLSNIADEAFICIDSISTGPEYKSMRKLLGFDAKVKRPRSERIPHLKRGARGSKFIRHK